MTDTEKRLEVPPADPVTSATVVPPETLVQVRALLDAKQKLVAAAYDLRCGNSLAAKHAIRQAQVMLEQLEREL